MSKAKTLTWNDRIALIDHYKPSDEVVLHTFDVTQDELDAVRSMRSNGTFIPTKDIDYQSYINMFTQDFTQSIPSTKHSKNFTSTSIEQPDYPQSATKKIKTPQKRGRKGSKISNAFVAIPHTPTDAESFANTNKVSIAVLRQSKRFDKHIDLGTVRVKKDKSTGKLMIWREQTIENT